VADGRRLLGDKHRIPLREHENAGSEPNAAGLRREVAERGERLQDVAEWFGTTRREQHMIVGPERRIAECFGRLGDIDNRVSISQPAVVRQV
jgi:hypothetical protein